MEKRTLLAQLLVLKGHITEEGKVVLKYTYGHPCDGRVKGEVTLLGFDVYSNGKATGYISDSDSCVKVRYIMQGETDESYSLITGVWEAPSIDDSGTVELWRTE